MVEIVFILDRSGSMSGMEQDTIGGFNSMLRKQKEKNGEAYVTTVLFDHEYTIIHDRLPIQKVPLMTEKDYFTRGSTALLDAVGDTIRHIAFIHKYSRREDVPEKTIFVITTDGFENASQKYDYNTVRRMIAHEKKKYGWEFLFLGANIDAAKEAGRIGISADRAVTFKNDAAGTQLNYASVGDALSSLRTTGAICGSWKEKIEEDVKKRGK